MKRLLAVGIALCLLHPSFAQEQVKRDLKLMENSLGMKLVLIPAGEFMMGSDETAESFAKDFPQYEKDLYGRPRFEVTDEAPVHKVRITKPFYLGQHEVTVGQWKKFLEESKYTPESIADGSGGYGFDPDKPVKGDAFAGRDPKYSWKNPGFKQGDDHPVVNITFKDATALCKWLTEKEGKKYRLPTEAEWEYACRAGTRTRYHNGNDPEKLGEVANVFDPEAEKHWKKWGWTKFATKTPDGHEFTAPVGSFKPNAFGLYDMHGNVWEWCSDFHADDYYSKSPVDDPQGPETGRVRVRRGGSWHTWPFYARASYRNWNTETTRYTLVGMRLVREP